MMIIGLMLLIIGISVRSISFVFYLFTGTILVGLGIAICNVILPRVVKDKFPLKVALMTSIYSTTMSVFASISSGISIPISNNLNMGWRFSLFVLIIPATVAIVIWMFINNREPSKGSVEIKAIKSKDQKNLEIFNCLADRTFYGDSVNCFLCYYFMATRNP